MKFFTLPIISIFLSYYCIAKERIIITGSSTLAPVISDLAKIFERNHQNIRIDVQTGGSSRGIADIRKNISNIGMVSRALKSSESDLSSFVMAKDGLAIITHKSNSVKNITKEQIKEIYSGKITNWKELGGKDAKIVVVHKSEGRSTLELFLKFFKLKNSNIRPSIIIGDNEQGIKSISTNPYSIGYVSIGAAEYNSSIGVPIQMISLNGDQPSVNKVEKGTYELSRELNIITKIKPTGRIKEFIEFVQSHRAHETIKEHFFVPIKK